MKKKLLAIIAIVMLMGISITGTLAWLSDKTDPVANTFTVGNIDIELAETKTNFKMVPGNTIEKDPKVTVKAGSEACYVFVKIEESANLDNFIIYEVADGWTELTAGSNIWWREQAAIASDGSDAVFNVIGNKGFDGKGAFVANKVLVKTDVTKADMDAIVSGNKPTLTVTAYAVQKDNVATAAAAWEILFPTTP